jgi:hypothetical protein
MTKTTKAQLAAVMRDGRQIKYISNPSAHLIRVAVNNMGDTDLEDIHTYIDIDVVPIDTIGLTGDELADALYLNEIKRSKLNAINKILEKMLDEIEYGLQLISRGEK